MRPGERTHHLNMSIMPLVNPLVIAPLHLPSFTNHCAVYMCLANANVEAVRPSTLPRGPPPSLAYRRPSPALHPSLPMYNQFTVHRSCATISVNYCEKRGPGRAYTCAHGCTCCLRHSQKQRGYCQVGKLNHSRRERACGRTISRQPLFWPTQ